MMILDCTSPAMNNITGTFVWFTMPYTSISRPYNVAWIACVIKATVIRLPTSHQYQREQINIICRYSVAFVRKFVYKKGERANCVTSSYSANSVPVSNQYRRQMNPICACACRWCDCYSEAIKFYLIPRNHKHLLHSNGPNIATHSGLYFCFGPYYFHYWTITVHVK